MGVVRINELPEASGLTSDDLLVVMDDPSGTAITKKIPINIFKTNEIDWTLIINSDNSLSAYNTTIIGFEAFKFTSIIGLRIGNNVTEISESAFNGCTSLVGGLTIPNSVTTIGDNAFLDCTGFTGSLVLPNSLITIGFQAFQTCGFTGSLVLPNSLTTIGTAAFAYSTGFSSLTIGSGVSSMSGDGFYGCSGFTNVNCYIERTIFPNINEFHDCTFTTLHARASDSTWDEGTTTLGDHTFDVIKDL